MICPGISYSDYYIAEQSVSIEQLISNLSESNIPNGLDRKQFTEILIETLGVQFVYVDDRKNELLRFHQLLQRYFLQYSSTPEEIDVLIYAAGDSIASGHSWAENDSECINIAYSVKHEFKLDNALLFNVAVECASTLIAMRIALSMLRDRSARKVLILSRNFYTNDRRLSLMGKGTLVSDGAGIIELSADKTDCSIIDFVSIEDNRISKFSDFITKSQLVVELGANAIKTLVERNSIKIHEISMIIPQNTTRFAWQRYCKILDIPISKVFLDNISDYGHVGDVDTIRNLTDVWRRGKGFINVGDFVILYTIGTGTTWAAILIQKTENS
ncbi:hypothetical protein F7734_53950 [Scytonema sp. UIC 10036]|uniref:3-oxoacyl-[acyl-carrier-protein] synthase III C-terminal domain-containing protein n=1 Tax=Scytonema sp. UIC 10036 TaxID=2304196 RepID=UPI0012DADCEE|nr:3-oxoacyl-[acyl-carrier-protein] synthase III C-terminal domain-containing protein [Scytonema sp. UIC 10036]MUH00712.1 hypothetical protein [Scytonema sp. UIC 10036]